MAIKQELNALVKKSLKFKEEKPEKDFVQSKI